MKTHTLGKTFSFHDIKNILEFLDKSSRVMHKNISKQIYIIKERLETYSGMESYLPNSDRHAASWIFSDGPTKPTGVVKLRYNALELFFDNVAI